MFDLIARVLAGFYELPVVGGSYGAAIIMLTMAVMVLLMPLTLKATRSTIKMQQVQPQLKAIQKEHKDDREKMNSELMALYSENGINPVGGCLPMLAQLPVFLVLFNVLRGLARRLEESPWFSVANQVRENAGLAPVGGRNFDPKYLSHDSQMYVDLRQDDTMSFGPFDLAERAIDVLRADFVTALPYVALIIFVVGSSYYQQRQVSARRSPDDKSPMNQQQQMLLRILPLFSGVWSFLFPAGLVVYWATSNLFRIGQQSYITRQIYEKEGAKETLAKIKRENAPADSGKDGNDKAGASGSAAKKKAKTKSSPDSNGSSPSKKNDKKNEGGDAPLSKADEWAQRRAQKAKSKSTPAGSSRVTPKGTAPAKKKRKR